MQRFISWDTIEARVDGAKLNALAASFRVDPIERMELQFFNGLLRISGLIRKFISVPFTVDIREILPSGHTVRAADLRGRWMLVFFGYTFCPDLCPMALNEIAGAPRPARAAGGANAAGLRVDRPAARQAGGIARLCARV